MRFFGELPRAAVMNGGQLEVVLTGVDLTELRFDVAEVDRIVQTRGDVLSDLEIRKAGPIIAMLQVYGRQQGSGARNEPLVVDTSPLFQDSLEERSDLRRVPITPLVGSH